MSGTAGAMCPKSAHPGKQVCKFTAGGVQKEKWLPTECPGPCLCRKAKAFSGKDTFIKNILIRGRTCERDQSDNKRERCLLTYG